MSERILTTTDVAINTVAIEVKVMKIGNRQVTLSVFKQLPKRDIIDDEGKICGTPWGKVNYCGDCPRGGRHLHIVFQMDNKLYRGTAIPASTVSTSEWATSDPIGIQWAKSYRQLETLDQLFIAV